MAENDASTEKTGKRLMAVLWLLELALGIVWIMPLITVRGSQGDYGMLSLEQFFAVYPLNLLLMLVGVWSFIRRPSSRGLAILVIITPIVLLPLPHLLNLLAGGRPLLDTEEKIRNVAVVLALLPMAVIFLFPRRVATWLPLWMLRSGWFNGLVLMVACGVYLPYIALVLMWDKIFLKTSDNSEGYALAYGLGAAVVYAALSFVPALLIFLYSYLSFFKQGISERKGIRSAQLVVSLPAVLIGVGILLRVLMKA